MSGFRRRRDILTDAVRGNLAARRYWRGVPRNRFTEDGYEVVPEFLDRRECDRLVRLADDLMTETSQVISGNCYTWVKAQAGHGRNTQVREILNVNDVDRALADLLASRRIQDLFEGRLGEPVELHGFSIQIDGVDTRSKRDYHVDTLYPPMFKAFVYLTDVSETGDGPYTIIPGSQRQFVRKAANDLTNAVTSAGARDMHRFATHDRGQSILGSAGTLILSSQDAMHKGWHDHSRRSRYALIATGSTERHFKGGPLSDGRPLLGS